MFDLAVILSDTHFTPAPGLEFMQRVMRTLAEVPWGKQSALVLAGDICDLFVGNRRTFRHAYAQWLEFVGQLQARGVQVFVIEGNHDFQLAGVFPGAALKPNGVELNCAGPKPLRLWVEHGDLANPTDHDYLRLRRFLRSLPMRLFIAHAPEILFHWVARTIQKISARKNPRQPDAADMQRLNTIYRAHAAARFAQGYGAVVMGHCHILDQWDGPQGQQYFNMGYPPRDAQLVLVRAGRLERLPLVR